MANAIVNFFKSMSGAASHVGGTLGIGGVGAIAGGIKGAYSYNPEEDEYLGETPVAGRVGAAATGAMVGGAVGIAAQGADYGLRAIGRSMMTPDGLKAYDAVNPNRPKTLFGALRQGFQTVAGGNVDDFEAYTDSVMDTVTATPTMAVQRQRQARTAVKGNKEAVTRIDTAIDEAAKKQTAAREQQEALVGKWQGTPAKPATGPQIVRQSEGPRLAAEDTRLEAEITGLETTLGGMPQLTKAQQAAERERARQLRVRRGEIAKTVGMTGRSPQADVKAALTDPALQTEFDAIHTELSTNRHSLNERLQSLRDQRWKNGEKKMAYDDSVKAGAKPVADDVYDERLEEMANLDKRLDPKNPENFKGATSTNPFASMTPAQARAERARLNAQLNGTPEEKAQAAAGIKYSAPPATRQQTQQAKSRGVYPANHGSFGVYNLPTPPTPVPTGKGADQFVEDYNAHSVAQKAEAAATDEIGALQSNKQELLKQEAKLKPTAENQQVSDLRRRFSQTEKDAMIEPGQKDMAGSLFQDIGRIGAGAAGMAAGAPVYLGRYAANSYEKDVLTPYREKDVATPTVNERLEQLAPKKTQKGNLPARMTPAEQNERQVLQQYKKDNFFGGAHRINRSYEFDPAKPGIHTVTPAAKPAKPGQPATAPAAPAGVPIRPAMNTGFMSDNALMFGLGGAGAAVGFVGAAAKASAYGAPADHPINALAGATKQNISAEAQMQADQSNRVRMTNPSMVGLNDADELYFQNPSLKPTRSRSRPGQYNDDGNLTLALSALRRG
jgi:hypothetical protein